MEDRKLSKKEFMGIMKKKTGPKLMGDMSCSIRHMYKVIKSCKTHEQLFAAYTWAHRVISTWEKHDEKAVENEGFALYWLRSIHERYEMYYTGIKGALESALINMPSRAVED